MLVLARAFVSRRDRTYALWLGLGCVAWALGDFVMTGETLGGATPATISLANWLWVGFFPLAYVGVMVLMQRDVRKLTAANYLDGVIATLVTSAALVTFGFHTIAVAAGGGDQAVAINLVYPVGDLLLFGLTLFGLRLLPVGQRTRWLLIAAAGLANAAGDISALFGDPGNIGWFLDSMAWPISLLLISMSAVAGAHLQHTRAGEPIVGLCDPGGRVGPRAAHPVRRLAQPHHPDRDRAGHGHAGGGRCAVRAGAAADDRADRGAPS